jgi:hypothetical protein
MDMEQWMIGDISIKKHVEMLYWAPLSPAITQAWDGGSFEEILAMEWLKPAWMNDAGEVGMGVHSFLIETSDGRRLIVDTGIGNAKKRAAAMFADLDTDFLDRLTAVGWGQKVWTALSAHTYTSTTLGGTPTSSTVNGSPPSRTPATTSSGSSTSTGSDIRKIPPQRTFTSLIGRVTWSTARLSSTIRCVQSPTPG